MVNTPDLPPAAAVDEVLGHALVGGKKTLVRVPSSSLGGSSAAGLGFATSADMVAATASYPVNTKAEVYADSNSSANGTYARSGGGWIKLSNLAVTILDAKITANTSAINAANTTLVFANVTDMGDATNTTALNTRARVTSPDNNGGTYVRQGNGWTKTSDYSLGGVGEALAAANNVLAFETGADLVAATSSTPLNTRAEVTRDPPNNGTFYRTGNGWVRNSLYSLTGLANALASTSSTLTLRIAAAEDRITALEAGAPQRTAAAQERPGDSPALFSAQVAGRAADMPPIAVGASQVLAGAGRVYVVGGADVPVNGFLDIVARQDWAVEPGKVYSARWVVQRLVNPSDPAGDSVQLYLVYEDANRVQIGSTPAYTLPLVIADGRVERQRTFSLDQAADVTVPAGARYVKLLVRVFGQSARTAIEVIERRTTNGLPGPKGDTGDVTQATLDARDQAVAAANEAKAVTPLSIVDTLSALKALSTATRKNAYLNDQVRAGHFVFRAGDYSAAVTADTDSYAFVKADDTAATAGAWVRSADPWDVRKTHVAVAKPITVMGNQAPYTKYGLFGPTAGAPYIDHGELALHDPVEAYFVVAANNSGVQSFLGANSAGASLGANTNSNLFVQWGWNQDVAPYVKTFAYGKKGGNFGIGDTTFGVPNLLTVGPSETSLSGANAKIGAYGQSDVRMMVRDTLNDTEIAIGTIQGFGGPMMGSVSTHAVTFVYGGTAKWGFGANALYPATDNAYALGNSGLRWSVIYSATGTINTSDITRKTDIQEIDLGLAFIRDLVSEAVRSWRFKDGGTEEIDVEIEVEEQETRIVTEERTVHVVVGDEAVPRVETVEVVEPVFDRIPVWAEVEETVMHEVVETVPEEVVEDDRIVIRLTERTVMRPIMDARLVVDAEGNPLIDPATGLQIVDRRRRTRIVRKIVDYHEVPRMVRVRKMAKETRPIEGSRRHLGLIAQPVKAVLDRHAPGQDIAAWTLADKNDPGSLQGLRMDQFIAPLMVAVAQLAARVEELEAAKA